MKAAAFFASIRSTSNYLRETSFEGYTTLPDEGMNLDVTNSLLISRKIDRTSTSLPAPQLSGIVFLLVPCKYNAKCYGFTPRTRKRLTSVVSTSLLRRDSISSTVPRREGPPRPSLRPAPLSPASITRCGTFFISLARAAYLFEREGRQQ